MKRGPKSILDDKFKLKIRAWILQGKTDEELASLSGVSIATINAWKWKNYKGFHDSYRGYKRERMLAKAEVNIDEFLAMDGDDKDTIRIKADMTKFVAETLGKKEYSKRTELDTGDSQIALVNIEKQIINIANGESKPILTTGTGSDESSGGESIQGRERRTIDADSYSVHSIRDDIQEILSKSTSDGSHSVREESSSGFSSSDESSDIS